MSSMIKASEPQGDQTSSGSSQKISRGSQTPKKKLTSAGKRIRVSLESSNEPSSDPLAHNTHNNSKYPSIADSQYSKCMYTDFCFVQLFLLLC